MGGEAVGHSAVLSPRVPSAQGDSVPALRLPRERGWLGQGSGGRAPGWLGLCEGLCPCHQWPLCLRPPLKARLCDPSRGPRPSSAHISPIPGFFLLGTGRARPCCSCEVAAVSRGEVDACLCGMAAVWAKGGVKERERRPEKMGGGAVEGRTHQHHPGARKGT